MNWDWNQLLQWFVTAFLGAGLVKLIDLGASRYLKRQSQNEERVGKLIDFLKDYGELVEYYRFMAHQSGEILRGENDELLKDESGKFVVEKKVLEPEPRFEEAIKDLKGTDIKNEITKKIATIRINSSEANDISLELDPSGDLKEMLKLLYLDTVYSIETVLKYKDVGKPDDQFKRMIDAISKADETRRQIRKRLQEVIK
jgi:hypothetical protein